MKPDYICIGVQKSGTCSLVNYINFHPQLEMVKKETHFFSQPSDKPLTNINNYKKLFNSNKIIGEKTPAYSYLLYALDRIYDFNPNVKLILLLREPISRLNSQLNMEIRRGLILKSDKNDVIFNDYEINNNIKTQTENSSGRYVIRGFYDEIIDHILEKFPKDNLYVGISEEIKNNKLVEYNKIYNFLGAKSLKKINLNLDTHISRNNENLDKKTIKKLYDIYKPHLDRLYQILGRKVKQWEDYYQQNDLI